MSKVSSANYPQYSSSSISVGDSKASTGVLNGVLTSDYDMSDAEETIYNYALSTLAGILPGVNIFDTDTLASIKSEVDAYKDRGIQEINDLYNSSLLDLENDAASRFGNLDNSIFADSLNDLESDRSSAVNSFAQDILAKQSELEADELTQRYALIELLSGLSGDIYGNALNAISTALGGSSSYNSYNKDLYNAISDVSSLKGSNSTNALIANLLGTSSGNSILSLLSSL
ncbi:MAG: hypothetical protein PHC64_00280 [Candidatus Gastranaerophilales bacterium]|nr:hypothetical protein [Candidatus Gastranaerophilales bacterium]